MCRRARWWSRKWCTKRAMSPRRARNGGTWISHPTESVEQVGAKTPGRHQRREVLIRGDHDAGINDPCGVPADPLDRAVLQRAEELGLGRRRQVGDLIQEQRAVVRQLELPPPATDSGRRAIFDAKQLRLEQRLHEGGAIDGDKRPGVSRALRVQQPRHELLAGPALALHQHEEVRAGQACNLVSQPQHRRAGADQRRAVRRHAGSSSIVRRRHSRPWSLSMASTTCKRWAARPEVHGQWASSGRRAESGHRPGACTGRLPPTGVVRARRLASTRGSSSG